MKMVCHAMLNLWLSSAAERFPVVEAIYKQGAQPEFTKLVSAFVRKHKAQLETIGGSGVTWKVSRLDSLYFLNALITSCPQLPDGIPIVELISAKPAEWWSPEDDRVLLYGSWQYGYLHYSEIKFSNDDEVPNTKLTARLKALISGLKTVYVKYKELRGEELPFNCDTLRIALSSWSKKEHRQVCSVLMNFGFPSPQEVIRVGGFTKPIPDVSEYFQQVVTYCYEVVNGESPQMRNLIEAISPGTCGRIVQRVEVFQEIRKNLDCPRFNDADIELFHYLATNGLMSLSNSKLIVDRFGTEGLEGKVIRQVKDLLRGSPPKRTALSLVPKGKVPPYEQNEDGSPIFPIKLSGLMTLVSLGKLVTDRDGFHSQRYIYPVGYLCERLYPSVIHPEEKVWYNCRVLDRGGDLPVFRVELKNDPSIGFEGNAPSNPWLVVVKTVEEERRKAGTAGNRSLTISGPEYYGFSSPLTIHLMQQMDGVDSLTKFQKRPLIVKTDEDDEANDESTMDVVPPPEQQQQQQQVQKPVRQFPQRHSHRIQHKTELTFRFDLVKNSPPSEVVLRTKAPGRGNLKDLIKGYANRLKF
jgi:chromodomain-helicase-DNA-binding protein 7